MLLSDMPVKGWMVTVRFEEEYGEDNLREYLHGFPAIVEIYPTYKAAADVAEAQLLNYAEAIYDMESVMEPLRTQILTRDFEEAYRVQIGTGHFHGWWCSFLKARVTITAIVEA
jgi:hypothetical protein